MNRHDRRRQRSLERKARRATGFASKSEAFRAGLRGELPPQYFELIETMARDIVDWIRREPGPLDLRWHDMTEDKKLIVAALVPAAFQWLAASPDAERLLSWLAPRHTEATLYQATWALKRAGQLPGAYDEVRVSEEARAFDAELRLVKLTDEELDAFEPAARAQIRRMQELARGPLAKRLGGRQKRAPVQA